MGFQGRPGPPGPPGVGEHGLPVSSEPSESMFALMGDLIPEEGLYVELQLDILYSGNFYRDLKGHKVFKGKKAPKAKASLDQRYFSKSENFF